MWLCPGVLRSSPVLLVSSTVQVMGESCIDCRKLLPSAGGMISMLWTELRGAPVTPRIALVEDDISLLEAYTAAEYFHRTVRERCAVGGCSLPPVFPPADVRKEALIYRGGSMDATVAVECRAVVTASES